MSHSSLTQKLQLSIAQLKRLSLTDALASVREIQADFRNLPRTEIPMNELVCLKFQMQHWKQRVLDYILEQLSASGLEPQNQRLIFALLAILELKPNKEQLKLLAGWVTEQKSPELKESAAFYFAQIAEHAWVRKFSSKNEKSLQRLAGPKLQLPIYANAPSRCRFEKWSRKEEFQCYQFEEEGVRYRGLGFLPGDVLLTNVNRDGNGVYTAVVEPRAYAYHLGVFAMISEGGRTFPVVIETYKLGVRAVPLSCFLSEKFSSYIEIYRLKARPEGYSTKFNEWAERIPRETRGYNFDTEDPDRSFLACTTIGTLGSQQAGGPIIASKSRYFSDPTTRANLAKLDVDLSGFLSLSDFVNDPALKYIGVIDNNHFDRNIARELCERQFGEFFRTKELKLHKLPIMFWLNWFGVKQLRAGTFLGKLIGLPYGLTQSNLPKGPEKVLAIIEIYEHQLARSVKRICSSLSELWDRAELLNMDSLMQAPEIKDIILREVRCGTYGFKSISVQDTSPRTALKNI